MSRDFDFEGPATTQGQRIDFKKIFFSPEQGISLIRIVSLSGKSFKSHFIKTKMGEKKFVKCPGAGCPLCIDGTNKPSTRYLLKIIDRKTGALRVWEFGQQIKTQIQEFVNDIKTKIAAGETDADDKLTDYNLELRRREPGKNPLYSINVRERLTTDPRSQSILANDASVIAADTINFEDLVKPWSIERINTQILGLEPGKAPATPPAPAPAPKPAVAAAPAPRPAAVATAPKVASAPTKPDIQALSQKASNLSDADSDWLD